MARQTAKNNDAVTERVEQALRRSNGSLRLWLVFETAEEAEAAKALLAKRKARHVEALSRQEWRRREERAFTHIARRLAGQGAPAVPANTEAAAEAVAKPSRARRGTGR